MSLFVVHQCKACKRTLLETAGPTCQTIKIKCRKCGAWNLFDKPERPEVAGEEEVNTFTRWLFQYQTVVTTGQTYIDCVFIRCNIVGAPQLIEGCTFWECDHSIPGPNCIGWGNTDGKVGCLRAKEYADEPVVV